MIDYFPKLIDVRFISNVLFVSIGIKKVPFEVNLKSK